MRLWGKTQDELDAERREYVAAREAKFGSPQDLGAYYAQALPTTRQQTEPTSQYFFGEDAERFDALPNEMAVYADESEPERKPDGVAILGGALLLLMLLIVIVYAVMTR